MRFKGKSDHVEEQGSYKPLPAGTYAVEIVEVTDEKTKNGDDMTTVKYAVISGEHKGRVIWDRILFMWDNPILGRAKHFLHMIGEKYEPEIDTESGDWVGKVLRVTLGIREYEGKQTNEVKNHLEANIASGDEESKSDEVPF